MYKFKNYIICLYRRAYKIPHKYVVHKNGTLVIKTECKFSKKYTYHEGTVFKKLNTTTIFTNMIL